jgi:hypothetical protein
MMCASRNVTTSTPGHTRTADGPPVLLLAKGFVAVEHALGVGSGEDDRVLQDVSRAVWLELVRRCPRDHERALVISRARRTLASAGVPACWRASTLLVRVAGWLLYVAHGGGDDLGGLAERCALGAARLERIALEVVGA